MAECLFPNLAYPGKGEEAKCRKRLGHRVHGGWDRGNAQVSLFYCLWLWKTQAVSFQDWGIGTDLSEGAKSALGTSSTLWHTGLTCSSSEPTAGTGEGQDVWIRVSKAHCRQLCSDFSPTKHLYPFLFPVSNKHHFMDSNLLYQCRMNFRRRRRLMELLTEKSRLVPESHDSPFCLRKQNHDNRKHTSFLSGDSLAALLSVEWLHGVLNVLQHPFCARGFTVNLKTVMYPCLQGLSQFTQSLALGVAFALVSVAPQLLIKNQCLWANRMR